MYGLNDGQLLGALGTAIGARRAVPVKFVQTATNAYAWYNIDAELAQLSATAAAAPTCYPAEQVQAPPAGCPVASRQDTFLGHIAVNGRR